MTSSPRLKSLACAFVLSGLCVHAQAAELTVNIDGIRAQTGIVKVAVVDSAEGWDGKAGPVAADAIAPSGERATLRFADLPPGRYAVMITHDENGNGKLDTNVIGMPIEGYGFSNNPAVMRKPTFDEARFDIGTDALAVDVALR